jgi:nitroreductase
MSGTSLMKLIEDRRSLRSYDAEKRISDRDIEHILEAARLAPSAENSQPWRFIVIRDTEAKARFSRECFSGIFTPTRFAAAAPVLLVLCADRAKFLERAGEAILGTALYQLDCGIAGEHAVLAAAELGIGSCWIGWFDKKKAKKTLRVPPSVDAIAVIALGYPPKNLPPRGKVRKRLDEIASRDAWGAPYGTRK